MNRDKDKIVTPYGFIKKFRMRIQKVSFKIDKKSKYMRSNQFNYNTIEDIPILNNNPKRRSFDKYNPKHTITRSSLTSPTPKIEQSQSIAVRNPSYKKLLIFSALILSFLYFNFFNKILTIPKYALNYAYPPNEYYPIELFFYNKSALFYSYLSQNPKTQSGIISSVLKIRYFSSISVFIFCIFAFFFISSQKSNKLVSFIFTIFLIFSDKLLMTIFADHYFIALSISLLSCAISALNRLISPVNLRTYLLSLFLILFLILFCTFIRIEYFLFYLPVFFVIFNCSTFSKVRFIYSMLMLLFTLIFAVIFDRLLGFHKINLDPISTKEILQILFIYDSTGVILMALLVISLLSYYINASSKRDYMFLFSLLFVIFGLLKVPISSSDSIEVRVVLIHVILLLLFGRIVCLQKSFLTQIILIIMQAIITALFYKFDYDDFQLYTLVFYPNH